MHFLFSYTPLLYLTQSLWRDEAFSVLVAERSIGEIIQLTAGDFTPPLHYLLLHFWIRLFGNSEISVRSLSTVFFIATVFLAYAFSRRFLLNGNRVKSGLVALLVCIHPMLIYYAFEARMYSQLVFLVLVSTYTLLARSWVWYGVAVFLALYTHPYALLAVGAHGVWVLLEKRSDFVRFLKSAGVAVTLFIPWLIILARQVLASGSTWYYPVSRDQALGVFGNLYTGYEGTPDGLWWVGKVLTLFFLGVLVYGIRQRFVKKSGRLLLSLMLLPVVLVLLVSLITPVYVGRYVLYVSVAQSILIGSILIKIPVSPVRNAIIAAGIGATVWFLTWYPSHVEKTPFRDTFTKIQQESAPEDPILVRYAHNYPEALYYVHDRDRVYVFHPDGEHVPPYIGTVIIPQERVIDTLPSESGVIVYGDGTVESFDTYRNEHEQ